MTFILNYSFTQMFIIFWKGKVWTGLQNLLTFLQKDSIIMNDQDYNEQKLQDATQIIVSPWIPPHHKLYQKFQNKIISELNFTWKIIQQLKIRHNLLIIWISWTNGKSTTAHIAYELFQKLKEMNPLWNKIKIHLSGNFWTPFSQTLTEILQNQTSYHLIIIEVSSFMLYNLKNFIFDYSILTNIETDHLDRHLNTNDYRKAKINLIKFTNKLAFTSTQIYNSLEPKLQTKTIKYWHNYNLNWTKFIWYHNKANLQAIYFLTKKINTYFQLNLSENTIKEKIKEIQPLDHRLQLIRTINNIKIYDDTICTSSHAQQNALRSFEEKIILICGWYDKWDSFQYLANLYKKKVTYGVFIWTTAPQFEKIFKEKKIPFKTSETLHEAIQIAFHYATQNNTKTILFSPGCASFDMFQNVYDRIKKFTTEIQKLS